MAKFLTSLLTEKKAKNTRLLHLEKLTSYCDYIIVASATSERHSRALADYLIKECKNKSIKALGTEGYDTCQWILIDYSDIIVHIFSQDARMVYDLDGLWSDAPSIPIEDEA